MSMKAKILELLREKKDRVAAGAPESEAYVSGQELCEQFGVSRTAVWKAIGQLKKEGYVIEAVQNRGYRLLEPGGYPEQIKDEMGGTSFTVF